MWPHRRESGFSFNLSLGRVKYRTGAGIVVGRATFSNAFFRVAWRIFRTLPPPPPPLVAARCVRECEFLGEEVFFPNRWGLRGKNSWFRNSYLRGAARISARKVADSLQNNKKSTCKDSKGDLRSSFLPPTGLASWMTAKSCWSGWWSEL